MLSWAADLIGAKASPERIGQLYRRQSPALSRRIALERFRKTVRYVAKHSPFYREAFGRAGIDAGRVRYPADMGDFYTTPEDLASQAEKFICKPPAIVFESSGTSGQNKRIFYGRSELDHLGKMMAAGLGLMGMRRDDKVANTFDFSMWIPGMTTHYGLMASGVFCMAFGKIDPLEVYRRLDRYGFTVIMGEPTWLIRLTELAEKDGGRPMRLLIGGAEEMPAAAIPWMQKVWKGATVKMCYGSVEQGSALGFQPCDRSDGYHLNSLDFLPEIIEPDEQGYGEMVFTTLSRDVMPLVRYRTRDITRLQEKTCACGIRSPFLEKLRGRRDELVVASGGNLYPLMFQTILNDVPELTHDWQVVFKLDGVREVLELNVESFRTDHDVIDEQIRTSAAFHYPDLMKNLALGIFRMETRVHQPGQVRTARKLKRLVDIRHMDGGSAKLVSASALEGVGT
ncbi:MAG TPA: AMP-binding protein [Tepidisphaeraceae bacterium]|nr:AMP-binding protein [Tepidisphaeraceae bacterium]